MIDMINIEQKFELIQDYWSPKIIGELNGQHVKLAKIKGDFIWHHHDHEDEMFMVIKGKLIMELRDKTITAEKGEIIIVPKGVEHLPKTEANQEVWIMLFEPASTVNTGKLKNDRTVEHLARI